MCPCARPACHTTPAPTQACRTSPPASSDDPSSPYPHPRARARPVCATICLARSARARTGAARAAFCYLQSLGGTSVLTDELRTILSLPTPVTQPSNFESSKATPKKKGERLPVTRKLRTKSLRLRITIWKQCGTTNIFSIFDSRETHASRSISLRRLAASNSFMPIMEFGTSKCRFSDHRYKSQKHIVSVAEPTL